MIPILGVDACKGGWICIGRDLASGSIFSAIYDSVEALLEAISNPIIVAIDIPIGLTESGPRECDLRVRQKLGSPRSSSVFPAPLRQALKATSREEADEITRSIDGKGVPAQAWGIYPRIREVDLILRANPRVRRITYEVHPELSFMAWNDETPLGESKKTYDGMRLRSDLIEAEYGREARATVRREQQKKLAADDDIHDAFAALWTAERIYSGLAETVPNPPSIDSEGLEMAMWY
jgi:predicted RNase H-like nuclease